MDILDIDEALKDDSFIFLEDKTHDDVSNILQQWRSNNCLLSQTQRQQPHQEEQAYKLNSRTFTRPKMKSVQNLETQFLNTSYTSGLQNDHQQEQQQQRSGAAVLNVEIGGLVTTMHKSLLQDTSPPSSVCSSMDLSVGHLNNSLITSDDFSNINFLHSTQNLDFNEAKNLCGMNFDFTNKSTNDGYTLSDMIRDRKVLESLTLSGDGTLFKDSQIAQIDDISLTLSKTASCCSTMNNSTESVEEGNNQTKINIKDNTYEVSTAQPAKCGDSGAEDVLYRTMVLSDEMIGDTTFNLVENSVYGERVDNVINSQESVLNATQTYDLFTQPQSPDETFKKLKTLGETMCLSGKANSTFECQEQISDPCCHTPENVENNLLAMKFYFSTPQTSDILCNKQQYNFNVTRVLNETFEQELHRKQKISSDILPQFESMELIENVENPNETYNSGFQQLQQSSAGLEMQNVMDLAQAEADLLAGNNDEEEFEQMLDEFSKVELNAEQLKMKKSLDTIKKRFNCGLVADRNEQEVDEEEKDMSGLIYMSAESMKGHSDTYNKLNTTMEIGTDESRKIKEVKNSMLRNSSDLNNSKDYRIEMCDSSMNGLTSSAANSSGERLLSRRSRLYDDINVLTLSTQSKTSNTSFTMKKNEKDFHESENKETEVIFNTRKESLEQKTDEIMSSQNSDAEVYKHAQKRDRDRDRFKTIKIVKQRNSNDIECEMGIELNVPCIDNDTKVCGGITDSHTQNKIESSDVSQHMQRNSRRGFSYNVFNNNKSEVQESAKGVKQTNINYLTYKKPKDKLVKYALPNIASVTANNTTDAAVETTLISHLEPRSLSRPRYISGLQRITIFNKATSVTDLKTSTAMGPALAQPKQLKLTLNTAENGPTSSNSEVALANFNRTQPSVSRKMVSNDLKSPMGIKSKSFNNLSSNFGYNAGVPTAGASITKTTAVGLRKTNNEIIAAEKQIKTYIMNDTNNSIVQTSSAQLQEKSNDAVFKVPKLVSGIRGPSTIGIKRACLVRPSSGYYSLNIAPKIANNGDIDTGRHSPIESVSSASSSRGSNQSIGSGLKPMSNESTVAVTNLTGVLNKITTGSSGIPKPSGLRPPSNVNKRSALPRPSSFVRR